jgi:hypothetical protein
MPIVFAIPELPFSSLGLLRKSKPDFIKALAASLGLFVLLVATPAGAARPAPLRLVRIAVDSTSTEAAQHATIVEPDAAASGSRIVATFQVGRFFNGSAGAIGFSTSTNAGRTWHSGLLPRVPPAEGDRASDPVVAYDTVHARWLITTLVNTATTSSLFVNSSPDGLAWDAPATAIAYPRDDSVGTALDKEWLTCDNGAASPFRGRCYLAYTDIAHDLDPRRRGSNIGVQSSTDGGVTWSAPILLAVDAQEVSPAVQPVVRPNGELVIVFLEDGVVRAVRSKDGGATLEARERVSGLTYVRRPVRPERLRGFSLPSAAVDRSGVVYAAWADCRFRPNCSADDIVWTRSSAPGQWTPVRRVPLAPRRSPTELVLPDLAVDGNRLALSYYSATSGGCVEGACVLDVYLVTSKNAGKTWARPRRLNPRRMPLTWLAETASGRMVGDYMGTVFSGSRVVAVHVQARAPRAGVLNETVYAASLPRP